jgi:HAD superfamily hydrolase (TIGR01549 family)
MKKAIIFDFGQTLVDSSGGFHSAEKKAEQIIFDNLKLTSWPDFIANYRKVRTKFKENSNFSRRLMWQEVYSVFNQQYNAELLERWEQEYWQTVIKQTEPFPETEIVLKELYSGYLLAVITNTQGQVKSGNHRITLMPQLEKFFKIIIVAGESGIPPKPDPWSFSMCLEKLGVTGDQAVYIGDDWHIDIAGARRAGIQPIWLKHYLVKRNWPDIQDTVPVINSLNQLLDLKGVLNNSINN